MGKIAGRTVLVTRSAADSVAWAEDLADRGACPVVFPCIGQESIRDPATAAALGEALATADSLALTSVRGVAGAEELIAAPLPTRICVATVGHKTAAAATSAFGRVDLVAPGATGRSLAESLQAHFATRASAPLRKVVAAGAEGSRRDLEEVLEPAGVEVVRIPVYRTIPAAAESPRQDLTALQVDTIFLASPSAVVGLVARADVPNDVRVITIGPSTTAAARQAGLHVDGEATGRGLDALIEALP